MSILEQLDITYPILLAPMAGVSTPELAAEVSNAGGLGSLGLGSNNIHTARQMILKTKELTNKPFQINFFCHQPQPLNHHHARQWIDYLEPEFKKFNAQPPQQLNYIYNSFLDNDDYLNLVLETQPKAVSFHFGLPHQKQINALKDAGILTLVSATNLLEAQAIEAAGIDFIIAQGVEAGGHRGIFNPQLESGIVTCDLVRLIVEHCQTPVIAAGGIMNGNHALEQIALGAQAVQLGTAFIPCPSSNASADYRKALLSQPQTQISACLSGRPARGIINQWHKKIDHYARVPTAGYPWSYDIAKQLHSVASLEGNQDYAAFWAGARVSQCRELSATDLMQQLVLEMNLA